MANDQWSSWTSLRKTRWICVVLAVLGLGVLAATTIVGFHEHHLAAHDGFTKVVGGVVDGGHRGNPYRPTFE